MSIIIQKICFFNIFFFQHFKNPLYFNKKTKLKYRNNSQQNSDFMEL